MGLKALGMDHGPPSIADARRRQVWFCSDEHLTFSTRPRPRPSATGSRSWPAHVDPTVAYHERMVVVQDDEVVDTWPVDLRTLVATPSPRASSASIAAEAVARCRTRPSPCDNGRQRPRAPPGRDSSHRRISRIRRGVVARERKARPRWLMACFSAGDISPNVRSPGVPSARSGTKTGSYPNPPAPARFEGDRAVDEPLGHDLAAVGVAHERDGAEPGTPRPGPRRAPTRSSSTSSLATLSA